MILLALLQLSHVGFGGVEEDALLECRCPFHLHFNDKLPSVGGLAPHIHDAVLSHGIVRGQFGREIFYFRYLLLLAERLLYLLCETGDFCPSKMSL